MARIYEILHSLNVLNERPSLDEILAKLDNTLVLNNDGNETLSRIERILQQHMVRQVSLIESIEKQFVKIHESTSEFVIEIHKIKKKRDK